MDTLYTFLDNITHYETKSLHFWGLVNSATKGPESGSVLVFGPVSLRVVVLPVAGKTYLFRVPYSAWVGAKVLKQWVLVQCFH